MRYKVGMLLLLLLSAAVSGSEADLKGKEESLLRQRRELEVKMHQTRVELIKKDPELQVLHRRIMALHKELALKVDASAAMTPLRQKAAETDKELYRVRQELEKLEKKKP